MFIVRCFQYKRSKGCHAQIKTKADQRGLKWGLEWHGDACFFGDEEEGEGLI